MASSYRQNNQHQHGVNVSVCGNDIENNISGRHGGINGVSSAKQYVAYVPSFSILSWQQSGDNRRNQSLA